MMIAGAIIAVTASFILGLLLEPIAGSKETTPRYSPIAIAVFAVAGAAAICGFILVLRSKRRRWFLIGFCGAVAVTALIEGLCFVGSG